METGYRRTLQNLPEPLRSRMLRGDFGVGQDDDEWQVIPTDWVLQAQSRWKSTFEEFLVEQEKRRKENLPPEDGAKIAEAEIASEPMVPPTNPFGATSGTPLDRKRLPLPEPQLPKSLLGMGGSATASIMTSQLIARKLKPAPVTSAEAEARKKAAELSSAVGVDVSRGGKDDSIICNRLENWFAELLAIPGKQTKDGNEIIQALIDLKLGHRRIQIDVTGVGTSPVDIGKMMGMDIVPMVMSEKSTKKDRSGKLGFANRRAEWWWGMREALDPALGEDIALPPDPGLTADLTAPLWSLTARGILVEPKEHVKERLGRSPDKGDAAVLSWASPHLVAAAYLKFIEMEVAEKDELEAKMREARGGRGL